MFQVLGTPGNKTN